MGITPTFAYGNTGVVTSVTLTTGDNGNSNSKLVLNHWNNLANLDFFDSDTGTYIGHAVIGTAYGNGDACTVFSGSGSGCSASYGSGFPSSGTHHYVAYALNNANCNGQTSSYCAGIALGSFQFTISSYAFGQPQNIDLSAPAIYGCTASTATNYNPYATNDDGSCYYTCNDSLAINYNATSTSASPCSYTHTDTHPFKYVPYDTENSTAVEQNMTIGLDSNGKYYWAKTTGTSYIQTPATWTTQAYVYVFMEGNGTYLYNQMYVNGGTGHSNLSFFDSFGHDPDKLATFTVDGKTISLYRLYTQSGITPDNNLSILTTSNSGNNPYRIYGVVPSNGTPSVANQAQMYAYLNNFSGSPCSAYNSLTCITRLQPDNQSVYATTTVTFRYQVYVDPSDIGTLFSVNMSLRNIDFNSIGARFFSPYDIQFLDNFTATTSGYFDYATTTVLPAGNYAINATIERSYLNGIILNPLALRQELTHYFVVGSSTFIGKLFSNTSNSISTILNQTASTTAQTSVELAYPCSLWDNGSTVITCLGFLLVPSITDIENLGGDLKDNVLTHFPLGYITDFVAILGNSTTSQLYVINATLPSALGLGSNKSITLSVNHVLDFVLNATTSQFTNASAPDTRSLFDITNDYWKKLLYLGLIFYIVSRLLGSHLMPNWIDNADTNEVELSINNMERRRKIQSKQDPIERSFKGMVARDEAKKLFRNYKRNGG